MMEERERTIGKGGRELMEEDEIKVCWGVSELIAGRNILPDGGAGSGERCVGPNSEGEETSLQLSDFFK